MSMRNKKLLYLCGFIFSVLYLLWRGIYTIPINGSIFVTIYGVLLWFSEILSIATAFIMIWNKESFREEPQPTVGMHVDYPDVDILVTTHNEEVSLLYKTINACTFLKYPDKKKVHIYICDDMNRPEMSELARHFQVEYIGLEHNKEAKAGNLNNAMLHSSSPLVATFDADMVPYSDFLLTVVPYFSSDYKQRQNKNIGFVQTPQSFQNVDIFQHNLFSEKVIPNEQDFFSKELNILNSGHDSAIYTGSNTLFLRQAIVDAGGFPTNTLTEDFQLGIQVNEAGYASISTDLPMASGVTPNDIASVLKQRIRWARGMIQSVKNLNLFFTRKLTWRKKIIYLNGYLYWWSFLSRILFTLAPVLFALFDVRVVKTDFWIMMIFWMPGYVLLSLSKNLIGSDVTTQRWGEIQEAFFAPYLVIPVILEHIGFKQSKFLVTSKKQGDSSKDWIYAVPNIIILILLVISIIKFNYGKFGSEMLYGSVITFWLINNLINTFLAICIIVGKPSFEDQYFAVKGFAQVDTAPNDKIEVDSLNEKSIKLRLTTNNLFSIQNEYTINILTENYTAKIKMRVIDIITDKNGFLCLGAITIIDEQNYRKYLQIIHDGFNDILSTKRDRWFTTYDLLSKNMKHRFIGTSKK